MADILAVGLSQSLARWLETRVPGLSVTVATRADDVLHRLTGRHWDLLIVDEPTSSAPTMLREARQKPPLARLPVIYALERGLGGDFPSQLIGQYGVSQILFHPLDREELAHQVALALGVSLPPRHDDGSDARDQTSAAVAALWDRFKGANLERVAALEDATRRLESGALDADGLRQAEREAHKLAGAVGTFGFARGSDLAREIERLLGSGPCPGSAEARRAIDLVSQLRAALDEPPARAAPPEPASPGAGPLVLVVDDDPSVCQQLILAARSQGLQAESAASLVAARESISRRTPDAVLLDLAFPDSHEDGLALLAELSDRSPSIPVMVLTARDEFTDRVEVARLGGRGFLRKSLSPTHVVEAVEQMIARSRANESKVLAVDDDPVVLAVLRTILEPRGLKVTTIDDPLRFWDALKECSPDLVVLDVDMPRLSGIELCRVIRNEARWASTPVLFLTVRNDPDSIYRIFDSGADDYVAKPIVGPELVSRITNRLERVSLYRKMADTDFLTGLANSRKATQALEQLMLMADRHGQPMCLSIVDVDRFKRVNDEYGHAAGDAVLRRIGELLARRFRGTDLVARWGGEEFVLAMYGMTREDGVHRVAEALELVRTEKFVDDIGGEFTVSFSAGVAQFPDDGTDHLALYRAADEALYAAKSAGRDRVLPVGWQVREGRDPRQVEVAVADERLAELLTRALTTRGYRAARLNDSGDLSRVLFDPTPNLHPSLVLLADALPGLDLTALSRRLGEAEPAGRPRVILLASGRDEARCAGALFHGDLDVVADPFDLSAVMARVRRALKA